MSNITIKISQDFSQTPGARYRTDGKFSGQEFREDILVPIFEKTTEGIISIDLDGTEGYATSFLEEAFGGLARKFTPTICSKRIKFISSEDPLLIDEILEYIENCCE